MVEAIFYVITTVLAYLYFWAILLANYFLVFVILGALIYLVVRLVRHG